MAGDLLDRGMPAPPRSRLAFGSVHARHTGIHPNHYAALRTRSRLVARFLGRLAIFLAALAVCLELLFRFVVPATEYPVSRQDPRYLVMQYDTTGSRAGTYTTGRLARHRSHWRVNNMGWISAVDYTPGAQKMRPRIAIIGDSYIEAVYLDVDKHLARVVQDDLPVAADVYSLGAWGVDLGQMVMVARYAAHELDPDVMVLVVEYGPLARTPRNLAWRPLNLQLEFAPDGGVTEHLPQEFFPSPYGMHLKLSAAVRYLRMNAKVPLGGGAMVQEAGPAANLGQDVRPELSPEGLAWQRGVCRWLTETLAAEFPDTRFLFLLDGDRKAIARGERPEPLLSSGLLAEVCDGRQFRCLDLTEPLWAAHEADGVPLQWDYDYHWNEHAVRVIGRALAAALQDDVLQAAAGPSRDGGRP